jgi:hypothetical protein
MIVPGGEPVPDALASYQAALRDVRQSSQPLPDVEGIAMEERTQVEKTAAPEAPATRWTLLLAGAVLLVTMTVLTIGYRAPLYR